MNIFGNLQVVPLVNRESCIIGLNAYEQQAKYHFHNRTLDGQFVLVFQNQNESSPDFGKLAFRIFRHDLFEDTDGDFKLVGEVETETRDRSFCDRIVPLRQMSEADWTRTERQARQHHEYRLQLYKQYSLADRIRDLEGTK